LRRFPFHQAQRIEELLVLGQATAVYQQSRHISL
jgi:hypothetical protein